MVRVRWRVFVFHLQHMYMKHALRGYGREAIRATSSNVLLRLLFPCGVTVAQATIKRQCSTVCKGARALSAPHSGEMGNQTCSDPCQPWGRAADACIHEHVPVDEMSCRIIS